MRGFKRLRRAVLRLLVATAICAAVPSASTVGTPAAPGVAEVPCPPSAIAVAPGASIQAAVDRAGEGAAFCLKNGIHRMQVIRPKPRQSFHGEGRTVLNGSRRLTAFSREGPYWVASGQRHHIETHGRCSADAPACNRPEWLFIDDKPLSQVLTKDDVQAGRFYLDHENGRLYLADDPQGRKVEATMANFAFEGTASDVLIRNLVIEKYASVAQKGAIQARPATGWTVENCEMRLNSGAGIAVGTTGRVRNCDIHHNGQIGITGVGNGIVIENNQVWANNIRGFDFTWEAGGVKLAVSDGVTFRDNHVHDNAGPGLWCDIDCRNVVYEGNLVERNADAGIFHEISFKAVIRNNRVRHNGTANRPWFWGADILVAASQDVAVYGNTLTVSAGRCGIILIDQSRPTQSGGKYKTRDNTIHDNETTFEGSACAGGVSDAEPDDENFSIIAEGNNHFDRDLYHVPRESGPPRLVWGHARFDWDDLRQMGVEPNGEMATY